MCFKLGVEYDDLPGEGRAGKARELIRLLQRKNRLDELAQHLPHPAHKQRSIETPSNDVFFDPLSAKDVWLPGVEGEPSQSRSPPRISLSETDVLQLLSLVSEHPMNVAADGYINERSFFATLVKQTLSLVGRIKKVDETIISSECIIIDFEDKMPENYGVAEREVGDTRDGETPDPIRFEQAIFLTPKIQLSKNLRLLQQHQASWRYIRVDHPITEQSVVALTKMRQIIDWIDAIFDSVKERFDGCRRERDELRKASLDLEELFKNLPSSLAPREVSHEMLDKMEGYCDSISYYVDCCGKWLAALAEMNKLETS